MDEIPDQSIREISVHMRFHLLNIGVSVMNTVFANISGVTCTKPCWQHFTVMLKFKDLICLECLDTDMMKNAK